MHSEWREDRIVFASHPRLQSSISVLYHINWLYSELDCWCLSLEEEIVPNYANYVSSWDCNDEAGMDTTDAKDTIALNDLYA